MSAEPWTKLPALDGRPNPCVCCPPIPAKLPMDAIIAVGFGAATVTRDGVVMIDGERTYSQTGDAPVAADAEALAARDPDHDWRITLFGPLHGEEYQRQGEGQWVLIEKNEGFA